MKLYGREYSAREVMRLVGHIHQIGGVQSFTVDEGYGRGTRILDFRTAAGFHFTVHPERGMDVGFCDYQGAPLGWVPPRKFPGPWYYDHGYDYSWAIAAFGGFFNTAGLVHIGDPKNISTEQFNFYTRQQDRYGIHGRIAVTPAEHVTFGEQWDEDACTLWAEGTVREEIAYGEHLVLTRRYEADLDGKSFRMTDRVANVGFYSTPHQLLYHINIGFPTVAEGAELLASVKGDVSAAHDQGAMPTTGDYRTFSGPVAGYVPEAFTLPLAADANGIVSAAIVNRGFTPTRGIGAFLRYNEDTLPLYYELRMMGEGIYLATMEPATNPFLPVTELVEAGYSVMMQPGEERQYNLELGVLSGGEEIDVFERSLPKAEGAQ